MLKLVQNIGTRSRNVSNPYLLIYSMDSSNQNFNVPNVATYL